MIRVLVYEYLCCELEASAAAAEASLLAEGRAMLSAVVADFQAAPLVEVLVPDVRAQPLTAWAAQADFALVIAPEFDGILEHRAEICVSAGSQLLGPDVDAIRLTADKLRLCDHFQRHGILTPPTVIAGEPIPFPPPWVIKPRDGAGSQEMQLAHHMPPAQAARDSILQPFVPGMACSVAFIIGEQKIVSLPACAQHLTIDGRFHYVGGHCPIDAVLAERAESLAMKAVRCVPGLYGYVGVDLVLGERDWVIEINPRLTTSYIGLRTLSKTNLAEAMLLAAQNLPVDLQFSGEAVW